MASKNDVTGDSLVSKASSAAYADGWDRIFGKKSAEERKESDDINIKPSDDVPYNVQETD